MQLSIDSPKLDAFGFAKIRGKPGPELMPRPKRSAVTANPSRPDAVSLDPFQRSIWSPVGCFSPARSQ